MKKLLLAFVLFVITATSVKAQSLAHSMSGGVQTYASYIAEVLATINVAQSTTSGYHLSAGASVQVEKPVTPKVTITASGGYQNYQYKADYGTQVVKSHASFVPLLAGAKFKLSNRLYAHGQLGYSISTEKGGGGAFTYAPSIGTRFGKFDASVKYMALHESDGGTLGAVGVTLGYHLL